MIILCANSQRNAFNVVQLKQIRSLRNCFNDHCLFQASVSRE